MSSSEKDKYLEKLESVEKKIDELNGQIRAIFGNPKEELKLKELKEQLGRLMKDKDRWFGLLEYAVKNEEKSNTQKHYKYAAAIKSSRLYLNTVARCLFEYYDFEIRYKHATFGDVLYALRKTTSKKGSFKKRENVKVCEDLNDFFKSNEWDYLNTLHDLVTRDLHGKLDIKHHGEVTIILPVGAVDVDLAKKILNHVGFVENESKISVKISDSPK